MAKHIIDQWLSFCTLYNFYRCNLGECHNGYTPLTPLITFNTSLSRGNVQAFMKTAMILACTLPPLKQALYYTPPLAQLHDCINGCPVLDYVWHLFSYLDAWTSSVKRRPQDRTNRSFCWQRAVHQISLYILHCAYGRARNRGMLNHHVMKSGESRTEWGIRTPDEFCVKTTDPGKPFDTFLALKQIKRRRHESFQGTYFANGVTGSARALARRIKR